MFKILAVFAVIALLQSAYGHREPHECKRECKRGVSPKTCVYHFKVEWYRTLSKACWDCPANITHCSLPHCVAADGKTRSLITINRHFPGPAIEVCEDDTVVVYVTNMLEDGGAITLHWHGIHQRGTQFMDGVPMLTQCAVLQFNTFRYEFKADPAGTHYYHAHSGTQREEGLYGSLIIRQPPELEVHSQLYDYDMSEHTFIVTDWYPQPANNRFLEINHRRNPKFQPLLPVSGLINGKTKRYEVQVSEDVSAFTPPEIFQVRAGSKYRFRMISATGEGCQFRVSVEKHRLTAIASDGAAIKPVAADTITVSPGERHDFVLTADQAIGNYWMKAYCKSVKVNVLAVIRYEGAAEELPLDAEDTIASSGTMLFGSKLDGDDDDATYMGVGAVESAYDEDFTDEKVDMYYTMKLTMSTNDNTRFNHPEFYPVNEIAYQHYMSNIDNISFVYPQVPLLSQWGDSQPSWFCNQSTIKARGDACYNDTCQCTHMVELPKDKIVEITLVNIYEGGISGEHFMHLHGQYYRVMANGKIGTGISAELVQKMKADGRIQLRYRNPIYRDTVTVTGGGYMIIRLKTDNPGLWLFHCHKMRHNEVGQSLIFKVGNEEDWGQPPENFPRCGSFGTADSPQICPKSAEHMCRDNLRMCSQLRQNECYSEKTRQLCCYTCSKRHTGIKGCEYGDHYSWCSNLLKGQSCKYPTWCCQTCRKDNVQKPFPRSAG